ncbi:uncharacterized protein A4U43_C08F8630 [Asparagus officinalis]|nr:uncharacterized protein A4U43_C08F8630 [Asparagus officinalis]
MQRGNTVFKIKIKNCPSLEKEKRKEIREGKRKVEDDNNQLAYEHTHNTKKVKFMLQLLISKERDGASTSVSGPSSEQTAPSKLTNPIQTPTKRRDSAVKVGKRKGGGKKKERREIIDLPFLQNLEVEAEPRSTRRIGNQTRRCSIQRPGRSTTSATAARGCRAGHRDRRLAQPHAVAVVRARSGVAAFIREGRMLNDSYSGRQASADGGESRRKRWGCGFVNFAVDSGVMVRISCRTNVSSAAGGRKDAGEGSP